MLKANSKRISGNPVISGSPLGAQNKDFGNASQTLLNGVKLRLWRRLGNPRQSVDSGFYAMDSGFQVLNFSLCEGNFDSGFQSLVRFQVSRAVFRIPKPRIPDFTSKIISESGFNKQESPGLRTALHGTARKYGQAPLLPRLPVTICTNLYLVLGSKD